MAKGIINYLCRCIPGITIILWAVICWEALSGRVVWPWSFTKQHAKSFDFHHLDSWQVIYIVYSIFTHLSGCLVFPVRLVWAIWHITDEVRTARFDAAELSRPYDTESEASSGPSSVDDKSSALSVGASSNASTLTPDGPLSRVSTPKIAYFDDFPEPIVHAIILPSYKEDMDTLVETLSVLGSHCLAKSSYDIYLAMEQRDPHAVSTARTLIERFESSFRSISYTLHPGDIVGEVAGKSSNVSWSARQLSNNYTEAEVRRNVIISVMDCKCYQTLTNIRRDQGILLIVSQPIPTSRPATSSSSPRLTAKLPIGTPRCTRSPSSSTATATRSTPSSEPPTSSGAAPVCQACIAAAR